MTEGSNQPSQPVKKDFNATAMTIDTTLKAGLT
jgi:hypothetical protein